MHQECPEGTELALHGATLHLAQWLHMSPFLTIVVLPTLGPRNSLRGCRHLFEDDGPNFGQVPRGWPCWMRNFPLLAFVAWPDGYHQAPPSDAVLCKPWPMRAKLPLSL